MPTNDKIILDQILKEKQLSVASTLNESEYFELFTAEQILKDFDLSYDEIQKGLVGGGSDGGVDGIYTFVNGELLEEDTDYAHFKKELKIEVFLIQAKTKPSFAETTMDKFVAFTADLFDLTNDLESLTTTYNKDVLDRIGYFRDAHSKLVAKFPKLSFVYCYATKGDQVHKNVSRKDVAIKNSINKIYSEPAVDVRFYGASELLALVRREPSTTFSLKVSHSPISASRNDASTGFIALVKLEDFYHFISDQKGNLKKIIFDANVRDYQGNVQVNGGIQKTLSDAKISEDFWWLNNGITIIATESNHSGSTLHIENPLIVNGLQTSTEIFKYFQEKKPNEEERVLLVRVIVPRSVESHDRIIKATNSQTSIPPRLLKSHRNHPSKYRGVSKATWDLL